MNCSTVEKSPWTSLNAALYCTKSFEHAPVYLKVRIMWSSIHNVNDVLNEMLSFKSLTKWNQLALIAVVV